MAESHVARLARAIQWLDEELEKAAKGASEKATSLLKVADSLVREFENDVDVAVKVLADELESRVDEAVKAMDAEYEERLRKALEEVKSKAEANLEKAVDAVVKEIISMMEGA